MNDRTVNTDMFSVSAKYRACPGVILTSSCGRYYLVTASFSMEINETVYYYWSFLEKGTSAEELADRACSRYAIEDRSLVTRDIEELIRICLEKHLIRTYGGV